MSGSAHSIADIIIHKRLSVDTWQSCSAMLSIEIGDQLSFVRFLKSDGFETKLRPGWVQALDQVCRLLDFRSGYWAERVGRNLLDWSCHCGIRYHLICGHDGNSLA